MEDWFGNFCWWFEEALPFILMILAILSVLLLT